MTTTQYTTTETAARVWIGIRALVLDHHDRRKEVCEALGMSFIRVKALRVIAQAPTTLRQIAARLATDPPYVTIVVDDLERRGLVRREANPADRRSKIVTATADGAAAAAVASGILNQPPASVLHLDPDELSAIDRVVAKLLDAPPATP